MEVAGAQGDDGRVGDRVVHGTRGLPLGSLEAQRVVGRDALGRLRAAVGVGAVEGGQRALGLRGGKESGDVEAQPAGGLPGQLAEVALGPELSVAAREAGAQLVVPGAALERLRGRGEEEEPVLEDRAAQRGAHLMAVEGLRRVLHGVGAVLGDRIQDQPLVEAVRGGERVAAVAVEDRAPKSLPPDRVTALMTPPRAPKYWAERPEVLTCTSCRCSKTASCRWWPWTRLFTETLSTVKLFSPAEAPFTWIPPSSWPVFTEGSAVASDSKLRPLGRFSNSSAGRSFPRRCCQCRSMGCPPAPSR